MTFFILAGIALLFSLALFVIGRFFKKDAVFFEENKRKGSAEVVGYNRAEKSNWYSLAVKLIDVDEHVFDCDAGKIKTSDYPVGSIVSVIYVHKKTFGIDVFEVHLADNPPGDKMKISNVMMKISLVLFVVSVIMTIIGLYL